MGVHPQPLHQSDAYGFFINLLQSLIVLITVQGSTNVATKISQRKNKDMAIFKSQEDKIILSRRQPNWLNKSRATVSKGCTQNP
jgi:hypothetical protein